MFLDKIKIFIKDYGLYLVPLLASFFYFWKVSEISFWFDELVTINTIDETGFVQFFKNYYTNQLHPPLYFVILRLFYGFIEAIKICSELFWISSYALYYTLNPVLNYVGLTENFFYQVYIFFIKNNFTYKLNEVNEFSLRFISGISMTAIACIIFNFFKNKNMILFSVLLVLYFGLNVRFINFAHDARPYALMSLLSLLVFIEFYHSYQKKITYHNFKKLLFLNSLILLTHYYSIFIIAAQIIILVFKNAKHIRHWIAFFVMAAVAIIVFDYGYSLYKINEKIEILSSFDLNFLTDILHEYISYGGHTAALVFLVISFILKIYFKIKSPLDDILTKIFKFTALTLVIIFLVSLKWPILYVRYLMPLATLFVILYCGIFYIFSETVFFFVRHKSTKSIATACAFAITSVGILSGQYLNTFIRVNYYENEKYYYIEDGYKQIRMDSAKPEVVSYILEEHMPTYFKYYEKKYDVKKIVSVSPADSAHKKQAAINSGLELGIMPKTIYYIRVIHKELETQSELIKIKDYTPSLIFSRGNMHLYKFTSND